MLILWLLALADELRNARSVAVGGILRQYLSEEEPQNLVTENEDEIMNNPGGVLFGWREQYNRYKREKAAWVSRNRFLSRPRSARRAWPWQPRKKIGSS